MPIIPAQPQVEQKDTLSLRLDHAVHERLKQYAAFIQSPKDYVIGQALRQLFRKDKDFAAWLDSLPNGNGHGVRSETPETASVGSTGVTRACVGKNS
jgi:hypothetical protein